MRMRLGELLVKHELITEEELQHALENQKLFDRKRLGEILLESENVSKVDLLKVLALQLEILFLDLDKTEIDAEAVKLFPSKLALKYGCLPIRLEGNGLLVAMADPLNLQAIDDLNQITKYEIKPAVADRAQIENAIKKFQTRDDMSQISNSFLDFDVLFRVIDRGDSDEDQESITELKIKSQQAPIVRMANIIINEAIQERASDIHVEPQADSLIVRERVDGVLYEKHQLPEWIHAALVSRIKIMADMNIAEKRVPQDGKVRISLGPRYYDLRISTMPSIFGEKVVVRILDRKESHVELDSLGFNPAKLARMRNLNSRKQGMILLTGPTGSGKSTTLNAILHELRNPQVNIVTVEDPVEYDIAKTTQVQVNPKAGLTFPYVLRSILRQDPDIIMVGEIRDQETAEIAIRAAMTGHLLLSTLHTNDAISAIGRLVNLGIPPFLVSSTMLYVMAQRLVRRLCPNCSTVYEPSPAHLFEIERILPQARKIAWRRGEGCPDCKQRGFSGRIAVGEFFAANDEIRKAIEMRESESTLHKLATTNGMVSLLADFLEKVETGVTSITEIWSIVSGEDTTAATCSNCGGRIDESYVACPSCGFGLKEKCRKCRRNLEKNWHFCPYCQAEVRRPEVAPIQADHSTK